MFNNICFDVETGGFNCEVNPITEFACIVYNPITFEKLFEFESLIKPYNDLVLEADAMKVTGLNYEKCMDEGIPVEELVDVLEYIFNHYTVWHGKKWKELPILVGHNITTFDKFFLIHVFKLLGKDIFKYVSDHMFDTLIDSRLKWPDKKNHKLGDCCKYAGIDLVDAHRAMPDVVANTELHQFLLNSLRNENNNSEQSVTNFRNTFQF